MRMMRVSRVMPALLTSTSTVPQCDTDSLINLHGTTPQTHMEARVLLKHCSVLEQNLQVYGPSKAWVQLKFP